MTNLYIAVHKNTGQLLRISRTNNISVENFSNCYLYFYYQCGQIVRYYPGTKGYWEVDKRYVHNR